MDTKKKILLIVPMLHQGGFERVCVLTARLLQPYFDITIIVFDLKDLAYDIEGLNVINIDMGVKNGKIAKIINIFKRGRAVKKIKRELQADIAYSFGPTANLVNIFSGKKTKIWCGIRSAMDLDNPKMLRLFSKRSDLVICCSKVIEQHMKEHFNCKTAVTLYNPYDIEAIQRAAKEQVNDMPWEDTDNLIISMGREDDVKGFWHLIKSFSIVQREIPNAKLMIIGEGEFIEYKKLSEDLGVSNKVFFTGVKRNPFSYLAKGKIYVLTSINEGFPNALVEAMILGLPVIATDCMTGPAEILLDDYSKKETGGKYGILIPVLSSQKNLTAEVITQEEILLADQIKDFFSNSDIIINYREKGFQRCKDFSKTNYINQFAEFVKISEKKVKKRKKSL